MPPGRIPLVPPLAPPAIPSPVHGEMQVSLFADTSQVLDHRPTLLRAGPRWACPARPHPDHGSAQRLGCCQHAFKRGTIVRFPCPRTVIGPIGRHLQSGFAGPPSDPLRVGCVLRRQMDVAAPLDRLQSGFLNRRDHILHPQLPESHRNQSWNPSSVSVIRHHGHAPRRSWRVRTDPW